MKWLIALVVLLIVGAILGPTASGNAGYVLIQFAGWSIEATVVGLIVVLIAIALITTVVVSILRRLLNKTQKGAAWFSNRSDRKAKQLYEEGIRLLLDDSPEDASLKFSAAYKKRGAQETAAMAGAAGGDEDGTTYLSTVDSQGNLVSVTPSSFAGLAQGMILGDTGILINTRGCYFWLDPDNPNCIAPHKRPRTTPCTFIVLKNGKPFMSLGTPGGDSQAQCDLQVLSNIVDFGLNVQEAVEAPRFCGYSFPLSPWPHKEAPNRLVLEERISSSVADALRDDGHDVEITGPWGVSNGFAPILMDPDTGVYHGGADPRKESVMLGW